MPYFAASERTSKGNVSYFAASERTGLLRLFSKRIFLNGRPVKFLDSIMEKAESMF